MRRLLIDLVVAVVAVSALSAAATAPVASAATAAVHFTSCKASKAPKYPVEGGSWSGFKAHLTTCKKSYAVAKGYASCRLKHGPSGRCVVKVMGWSCREQRQTSPVGDFSAAVECSKDKMIVKHRYRQPAPA